jgi:hypothetical protein
MYRIALTFLAAAALISASPAATLSYTNTANAATNSVPVNLNLPKFNTGLGTLTGVVVTVNFLSLDGSFTVNAAASTTATLNFVGAITTLSNASNNNLGFSLYSNQTVVITTPGSNTTTTGPATNLYTITPTNVVLNASQTISNTFWSAYQTNGSGDVSFTFIQQPFITVTGGPGAFGYDSTLFEGDAEMTVSYNYDASAVPEPSTVAAGALVAVVGTVGLVRRRRRLL